MTAIFRIGLLQSCVSSKESKNELKRRKTVKMTQNSKEEKSGGNVKISGGVVGRMHVV